MFFRFIFIMSLIGGLGMLYLCIIHILDYLSVGTNYQELCDGFYPCSLFYSRFKSSDQFAYATSMFLFSIVTYFLCVYEWIQFQARVLEFRLFVKDNIVFARILFNAWDWSKADSMSADDQKTIIGHNVREQMAEERAKIKVANRSRVAQAGLVILRSITFGLTVLVYATGWVGIVLICYFEKDLHDLIYPLN